MVFSKILTSLVSISVLCIALTVHAANTTKNDPQTTPESILREIKSKRAGAVISELYADSKAWQYILRKIGSGDRAWIEVAGLLRPGSDAGASEMIELAVGEALENNPANVLEIATKFFPLYVICGGPDVDDQRYDSYELSMKAIDLRLHKVASINKDSLINPKKECIQYLEHSNTRTKKIILTRHYMMDLTQKIIQTIMTN